MPMCAGIPRGEKESAADEGCTDAALTRRPWPSVSRLPPGVRVVRPVTIENAYASLALPGRRRIAHRAVLGGLASHRSKDAAASKDAVASKDAAVRTDVAARMLSHTRMLQDRKKLSSKPRSAATLANMLASSRKSLNPLRPTHKPGGPRPSQDRNATSGRSGLKCVRRHSIAIRRVIPGTGPSLQRGGRMPGSAYRACLLPRPCLRGPHTLHARSSDERACCVSRPPNSIVTTAGSDLRPSRPSHPHRHTNISRTLCMACASIASEIYLA